MYKSRLNSTPFLITVANSLIDFNDNQLPTFIPCSDIMNLLV